MNTFQRSNIAVAPQPMTMLDAMKLAVPEALTITDSVNGFSAPISGATGR
ncbi:hypothetical protein AB4851_06360 [Burkholderia sp. 22PA0099]